jgi:hypothetical protein
MLLAKNVNIASRDRSPAAGKIRITSDIPKYHVKDEVSASSSRYRKTTFAIVSCST